MSQPNWKFVANLGDVTFLDYGGFLVFQDETGEYAPEAEVIIVDDEDNENSSVTVHRFSLDKCTFIDGILSDNPYHPAHSAWFATPEADKANRPRDTTYLSSVVSCSGTTADVLIAQLTSDNPVERAMAYREIGEYHGWANFDSYPLQLSRTEAKKRYKTICKAQVH
jgi:hypothetical protein